jgi:hypothetical protein
MRIHKQIGAEAPPAVNDPSVRTGARFLRYGRSANQGKDGEWGEREANDHYMSVRDYAALTRRVSEAPC